MNDGDKGARDMRGFRRLIVFVCFGVAVVSQSVPAASRDDVVRRLGDFQNFFLDFQAAPDRAVPNELLARCYGVIVMRQYRAGFIFGVKGGDGVIFMHDPTTGEWSAPAFIASGEGSFGFQIGGQAIDAIILIMNRSGADMLLRSRFRIGVDASAAVGPVGRDAAAQIGPGVALLAYSRAKGLYAGLSFEGGVLINNDHYNIAMYGMKLGIRDIVFDQSVPIPPEAASFIDTLRIYSGGYR
jgi:lipid-binding SYLF domain-containing protein